MGRDPGELYDRLIQEFGPSFYERIDAPATPQQKKILKNLAPDRLDAKELAGESIEATLSKAPGNNEPIGGIKMIAKSGWFAARPSGTEDVYKIYAESFRDGEHLKRIQGEAQAMIGQVLRS